MQALFRTDICLPILGFGLDWLADMGKPELAKLIAMEVRRLHELEIPGSKEPQLWNDIYKFIDKGIGRSWQSTRVNVVLIALHVFFSFIFIFG